MHTWTPRRLTSYEPNSMSIVYLITSSVCALLLTIGYMYSYLNFLILLLTTMMSCDLYSLQYNGNTLQISGSKDQTSGMVYLLLFHAYIIIPA